MKNTKIAALAVAGLLFGAAGLVALNTSTGRAAGHADPMFGFMHAAVHCLDEQMKDAQENVGGDYGQRLRNQYKQCIDAN
jgi:hypothetical protein